jgi:hypothetical protein
MYGAVDAQSVQDTCVGSKRLVAHTNVFEAQIYAATFCSDMYGSLYGMALPANAADKDAITAMSLKVSFMLELAAHSVYASTAIIEAALVVHCRLLIPTSGSECIATPPAHPHSRTPTTMPFQLMQSTGAPMSQTMDSTTASSMVVAACMIYIAAAKTTLSAPTPGPVVSFQR